MVGYEHAPLRVNSQMIRYIQLAGIGSGNSPIAAELPAISSSDEGDTVVILIVITMTDDKLALRDGGPDFNSVPRPQDPFLENHLADTVPGSVYLHHLSRFLRYLESNQKMIIQCHRQATRGVRHRPKCDRSVLRFHSLDPVHAEVGNIETAVFLGGRHVVPVVTVEAWEGQAVLESEPR